MAKTFNSIAISFIAVIFSFSCSTNRKCINIVQEESFVGTFSQKSEFGPPNFGETPSVDEKLIVPFIFLEEPILVCNTNEKIYRLQYVGNKSIKWINGSKINVKGRLSKSENAYHYFNYFISDVE